MVNILNLFSCIVLPICSLWRKKFPHGFRLACSPRFKLLWITRQLFSATELWNDDCIYAQVSDHCLFRMVPLNTNSNTEDVFFKQPGQRQVLPCLSLCYQQTIVSRYKNSYAIYQSESESHCDWRSVSLVCLGVEPRLGLMTRSYLYNDRSIASCRMLKHNFTNYIKLLYDRVRTWLVYLSCWEIRAVIQASWPV
jgi:hypothetical protein